MQQLEEVSAEARLWNAATRGDLIVVKDLLTSPTIDVNWRDPGSARTPLYRACGHNRLAVVEVLLSDPRIDVNQGQRQGATPLYIAAQEGFVDVVKLMLRHPNVNCSQAADDDSTPLYIVSQKGHVEILRLLLDSGDTTVVNKPEKDNCTPLWIASQNGHIDLIEHLMTSDIVVNTQIKSNPGEHVWGGKTAAQKARDKMYMHIVALIEEYERNPLETRLRLQKKLGITSFVSANLFALAVFVCDGLLTISAAGVVTPEDRKRHLAIRFFRIATQLPMELLMLLCHRAYGSPKSAILTKHSEPAFVALGTSISREGH